MRRRFIALLGIVALLLAACGPAATPTPQRVAATPTPAGPIKIGFHGQLTGAFSVNAKGLLNAIEFVIAEEGGQIAGRPIKIIPADAGYDIDSGLTKAKRLVELDKVNIMIGPNLSVQSIGMKDYIASSGIPWILPETGSVKFYPPANAITAYASSFHQAVPEIGKYLAQERGIKKAILIGFEHPAGADARRAVRQAFEAGGIEVIQELTLTPGVPDFGPYITKMKVDEPNLVISGALWGADAIRFMRQAEEFGVKKKALLAFPAAFAVDDGGLATLGTAADGVLNWFDLPPPDYPSPELERFVDAYKLKFGVIPMYAYRGYVVGKILVQAIKAVNGNVENSAALAKAIRQPVTTPTGTIKFDDCGNAVLTIFLRQIKLVGGQAQSTRLKEFPNISIPCPQPDAWK